MASVILKIGTDNTALQTGLAKAKKSVSKFTGSVGGMLAGAFTGGAILAGLKSMVDHFSRIQDLSTRLQVGTDAVQNIGFAAEQSGADLEMVVRAMTKMGIEANKADKAGGSLAETWAEVGINTKDFVAASADQKLIMLAGAYEQANGDAGKMATLTQLIGTRMADILPLLSAGQSGIAAMFAEAPKAEAATIASIERFGDSIDKLKTRAMVAGAAVFDFFDKLGGAFGGGNKTDDQLTEESFLGVAERQLTNEGTFMPKKSLIKKRATELWAKDKAAKIAAAAESKAAADEAARKAALVESDQPGMRDFAAAERKKAETLRDFEDQQMQDFRNAQLEKAQAQEKWNDDQMQEYRNFIAEKKTATKEETQSFIDELAERATAQAQAIQDSKDAAVGKMKAWNKMSGKERNKLARDFRKDTRETTKAEEQVKKLTGGGTVPGLNLNASGVGKDISAMNSMNATLTLIKDSIKNLETSITTI
jgi:hypothetical protein